MKQFKKILICYLLILGLTSVPICSKAATNTTNTQITCNNIPNDAIEYAQNNYKQMINIIKCFEGELETNEQELNNSTLGEPYVIYDTTNTKQDEIYYYPVLNANGKIILIISEIGTSEGWNLSVSKEMVTDLNKLETNPNDYIFYETKNGVVAENESESTIVSNDSISENTDNFDKNNFQEKKEIINNSIDKNFEKVNLSKDIKDTKNDELDGEYLHILRDDIYDSDYNKIPLIGCKYMGYKYVGQGDLPICWAAVVATIVNYKQKTSYTAKDVCKKINHSYTGASISTAYDAIKKYGVKDYNCKKNNSNNRLSYKEIKTSIDKDVPIYATFRTDDNESGHAVMVRSYTDESYGKYICVWNPSGSGSFQLLQYNSSKGTLLPYARTTYRWKGSLSAK